jgi:predicted AlkP superfamily phosphohydrolase/phosphomutase
VHGILHSTTPPITPAAWTTFLTGRQPGRHGILDFERYDPSANRMQFNSTQNVRHIRNLWSILGEHGLRAGSINVPMTYPAFPVNGFLVSGFETPGPDSDFVHPPELKPEILQRWPDPTLRAKWKHRFLGRRAALAENLDYVARSFRQGAEMTRVLGERFGWDVLMVVLKLVDNLQHKTWKHIDSRWASKYSAAHEMVMQTFERLDGAVGELEDYAHQHGAAVMIVSDHGHGSLEGKVQPNLLLRRWGYLTLRGGGAQGATRGRYLWDRLRGRTKKFARAGDIAHDLAVDFTRTTACVMHAGMAGFLYVNLKGRQPCGIVDPQDYERIRNELRERFLGPECRVRTPAGQSVPMFEAVHKPEELYGCARDEQPWMPDLMLCPYPSLAVIRKIRGRSPVRWLPWRRLEGTHRPEGILAITGPGIARSRRVSGTLADCAPTILAYLGLPVPDAMEGRVLTEIFETPPDVRAESKTSSAPSPVASATEVYSEKDLQAVTARLSELGYLE